MKWVIQSTALVVTLLAASFAQGQGTPVEGDKAPALSPTKWLNARANTTWKSLKGRVILVENWATT